MELSVRCTFLLHTRIILHNLGMVKSGANLDRLTKTIIWGNVVNKFGRNILSHGPLRLGHLTCSSHGVVHRVYGYEQLPQGFLQLLHTWSLLCVLSPKAIFRKRNGRLSPFKTALPSLVQSAAAHSDLELRDTYRCTERYDAVNGLWPYCMPSRQKWFLENEAVAQPFQDGPSRRWDNRGHLTW